MCLADNISSDRIVSFTPSIAINLLILAEVAISWILNQEAFAPIIDNPLTEYLSATNSYCLIV